MANALVIIQKTCFLMELNVVKQHKIYIKPKYSFLNLKTKIELKKNINENCAKSDNCDSTKKLICINGSCKCPNDMFYKGKECSMRIKKNNLHRLNLFKKKLFFLSQ